MTETNTAPAYQTFESQQTPGNRESIRGRENQGVIHDIVPLRPSDIADYQLAVFARQRSGQVPLSGMEEKTVDTIIAENQIAFLAASGDALTKEMLPGGGTSAPLRLNGDERIDAMVEDINRSGRYTSIIDEIQLNDFLKEIGAQGSSTVQYLGYETTKTIWNMRQALERSARGDTRDVAAIVADIAKLTSMLFTVTSDRYRQSGNQFAAQHIEESWQRFSQIVRTTASDMPRFFPTDSKLLIDFDRLLGSSHGYGPIVERFTTDPAVGGEFRAILDATKEADLSSLIDVSRTMKAQFTR